MAMVVVITCGNILRVTFVIYGYYESQTKSRKYDKSSEICISIPLY
ncbi:28912_t:CDS:2 [Gigaspora margarita]|uniref:28912_t:CDS:1 n=1 Tax=Gigaspora margarita TaxID=4874 RepID=A0ABN7UTJ8_GIGMA|nr:28912_t:CDS:2 [Gigaspora margarita]